MKILNLTVGPIVGETTDNRVRIWGRGRADIIDDMPRPCFGAIRYKAVRANGWKPVRYFIMNPNFDMTGIAVVTGLQSSTRYEYEIGYFFSDVELSDVPSFEKLSCGE